MSVVRVRLLGGALNGQVIWVEEGRQSLDVNVAAGAGVSKRLRYQIEGETAVFMEESAEAVSPAPKR